MKDSILEDIDFLVFGFLSLEIRENCYVEKFLADTKPMDHFQFQRIGYFCTDKDSTPEHLIFNRTVSLKDTWSKVKDKA